MTFFFIGKELKEVGRYKILYHSGTSNDFNTTFFKLEIENALEILSSLMTGKRRLLDAIVILSTCSLYSSIGLRPYYLYLPDANVIHFLHIQVVHLLNR